MPATAPPAQDAFEELRDTLNEDDELRRPVVEEHPIVALDPGARIMEGMDFSFVRKTLFVQPETDRWVRDLAERRGEDLSAFLREVILWKVNRVLTHGEAPPEDVASAEPGTRTEQLCVTLKPPHYTLAQQAMARWETTFSKFGAQALRDYRREVEE